MTKQTDTDPMPLAAPSKTATSSPEAASKDARRGPKDEDLSADALLQGLLNGPRAPFRASQAAESDGDDEAHFHAGARAVPRAHAAPSPEPGIVLSPSVVESTRAFSASREQGAALRADVATVVLPRIERRRAARRLAAAIVLIAALVGLVAFVRRSSPSDDSHATTSTGAKLPTTAIGTSIGTTTPSAKKGEAVEPEIQTAPPVPVAETSARGAVRPSEPPPTPSKIVQARPPVPRPSPSASARPAVGEKKIKTDIGEF